MDKNRLLLVEDDESLGYVLSEYLKMKNFPTILPLKAMNLFIKISTGKPLQKN
jgi:DNA-binding response OmpR family regulator